MAENQNAFGFGLTRTKFVTLKIVATFIRWFTTTCAKIQDAGERILITNLHIRANVMALVEVPIANSKHVDWLLAVLKIIVKIITLGLTY